MEKRAREFSVAGKHLVIAMPTYDGKIPVSLMVSLIGTIDALRTHGVLVTIKFKSGCALIDKARAELVHDFLQVEDATDILFADSDVVWQADAVLRLLAFSTEVDMVCGVYPVKQDEPLFHVSLKPGPGGKAITKGPLVEAIGVPMGFCLLTRGMIERMIKAYPVLSYTAVKGEFKGERMTNLFLNMVEEDLLFGEDIAFCRRWTKIGGQIWVDPEISLKHIGTKEYDFNYIDYVKTKTAEFNAKQQAESAA